MAVSVDTLLVMRRLRAAGLSDGLAEAHAEVGRDLLLANVSSISDLKDVERDIKNELAMVRRDVEASTKELRTLISELELRMTIKLGAIAAAAVALMAALQKLL